MRIGGNAFDPAPRAPRLTVGRVAAYVCAILAGLGILQLLDRGYIRPYLAPTFTPTRSDASFLEEGRSFYLSGQLEDAIRSYERAKGVNPANPAALTELARIQTYSSAVMISSEDKKNRLNDALVNVDAAIGLDANYGPAFTVRAMTQDWYADPAIVPDAAARDELLSHAYSDSTRALQLSPNDPIALAIQAEVLTDQARFAQALDLAAKAVELGPAEMDTHRVYAYVLESNALYQRAVEEYASAIGCNPNLPFLYLRRGVNYRHMGEVIQITDPTQSKALIQLALDDFAHAAALNPTDPTPYLAIANTYANQGEFLAAEMNARKAVRLDPTNTTLFGRLGVIYYKAKNYETALVVLRCAVRGCTAEENEETGVALAGLPLSSGTLDLYFTYGSVSAFYGECDEAALIFSELRASQWYDETIEAIIREGEVICAAAARKSATPGAAPTTVTIGSATPPPGG